MAVKRWWRGFTTYQKCLLGLFLVVWVFFAINPRARSNWLLENLLVAIFVPLIVVSGRFFRLSDFSYTLITLYLLPHLVGAHYNYSEVPFGYTLGDWFDSDRNHYDRLVHFCFGLLLSYPVREMFFRIASARGVWGYLLPLDVTLSLSAVYEIVEWLVAASVAPDMGPAFLGTQGDPWDAQKDMALAGAGAAITMFLVVLVNWYFDPHFWHEMRDSFRVKYERPLGEVRMHELLLGRGKKEGDTPDQPPPEGPLPPARG